MTTIFLLFLFVTQLISFYFLALLYAKVSKFDDLEKKQGKLMREMDDSITAYLSELKDENDRLIIQLASREESKSKVFVEENAQTLVEPITTHKESSSEKKIHPPKFPVNLALKSYSATNLHTATNEQVEVDDKTRALQLHDLGHSIEEIAKKLGKGQTEVKLILKFR